MSDNKGPFKTTFANNIFRQKYAQGTEDTWPALAKRLVGDVCNDPKRGALLSGDDQRELASHIEAMRFIPGGRYLYYAGRGAKFFNNCYLLRSEEDSREDWAQLTWKATSCLMTGGGIGNDYSIYRGKNSVLSRTGGKSSGPLPAMFMVNEIGRNVMQGGSRRSAIYASLNWQHPDVGDFLVAKNWDEQFVAPGLSVGMLKKENFNYRAPLDMTNISLNYDNDFLCRVFGSRPFNERGWKDHFDSSSVRELPATFLDNCRQALSTGEPGFSFNFGDKEHETLRNACTEVTSEDDSDVCNLGSINIGAIETIEEFKDIVSLASKFLVCGTLRADLPYDKVRQVRKKNRRLGLGLMGIHEWLLKRGHGYEVVPELHEWLKVYEKYSKQAACRLCDSLAISKPVAFRSIAPTGSIGILASTTTGIEPLFAVAYKRRYLKDGTKWKYEYVVDATAQHLIDEYGLDPEKIESAKSLATSYERRIKFQADVQDYVDMSISSTINLPSWGSKSNNPDGVEGFARILATYAPRLRGFTCYPDGARGGQPLTEVDYKTAMKHKDHVFEEIDVCEISGRGGTCGS